MASRKPTSRGSKKSRAVSVFLSYAAGDADLARRLADDLRRAGFEPWYADESITPGGNWALETGRALDAADVIVALISQESLEAPWSRREWEFALGSAKHAGRVVPVLTPGTDLGKAPWIVRHIAHIRSGPNWAKTSQEVVTRMRRLAGAA